MKNIQSLLEKAVKTAYGVEVNIVLAHPDEKFGDFASNVALQLAQKLGQNPRDVAKKIIAALPKNSLIASATVAGPGFINIFLTDQALLDTHDMSFQSRKNKQIIIETNNPNPFKDIHVGHAFNSIVADTIANLLEISGAITTRVSYHGDVGLHVGKSLWAIMDECGDKAAHIVANMPDDEFPSRMREWYARGAGMYEEEPSVRSAIEDLARQSFAPQGEVKKLYDICTKRSFDYFNTVFVRLGSSPTKRRFLESQTDAAGRYIVEQNIDTVFKRSNGAIIFRGEPFGLHTRVFISRHDTTLYEARDLGLIELKEKAFKPDESYIVTAEEQKEYFRVVLKAAELAMPNSSGKTINISTGMVKLTTGKMSSRKGQVVTIEWLFDQIRQTVKKIAKLPTVTDDIVIGAVRYAMLKSRLDSDIVFDVHQSVALEGNTGPYLQYAHARACSILHKANVKPAVKPKDLDAAERSLARKISEYPEVVGRATNELMPHYICTYLYELAQVFNHFYEHSRIIGDSREATRLSLVQRYAQVLNKGLSLLGIPAPKKM